MKMKIGVQELEESFQKPFEEIVSETQTNYSEVSKLLDKYNEELNKVRDELYIPYSKADTEKKVDHLMENYEKSSICVIL